MPDKYTFQIYLIFEHSGQEHLEEEKEHEEYEVLVHTFFNRRELDSRHLRVLGHLGVRSGVDDNAVHVISVLQHGSSQNHIFVGKAGSDGPAEKKLDDLLSNSKFKENSIN